MTASSKTAVAAKQLAQRTKPPFRADHVGSLLRPQRLLEARAKLDKGEFNATELRRIEDEAIRHAVKRQEDVGLKSITDGEFRRRSWHMDFICRIGGVVWPERRCGRFTTRRETCGMRSRCPRWSAGSGSNSRSSPRTFDSSKRRPRLRPNFQFLLRACCTLGLDPGRQKRLRQSREFLARSSQGLYRRAGALSRLGCTYLQIDDTMFATLTDPAYPRSLILSRDQKGNCV